MKSLALVLVFSFFNLSVSGENHFLTRLKLTFEDFVPDTTELINASGEKETPSNISTKYMVVYFTATWCGPCKSTTERLKKIKTKYHDELDIVVISYDSPTALKKYMSDKKDWYAVPSDFYTKDVKQKLNKLANQANRPAVPTVIVFDPKGKFVFPNIFSKKFSL
jgi:thiol-disulfide isomerase/thioredoxin